MNINGIIISQKKLNSLSSILSEDFLREQYEYIGFSDTEISNEHGISRSWVRKLRKIYGIKTDPNYRLRRNPLRFVPLSDRQKQFLYGSLLGDSCIAVQKSGTGYWLCQHTTKQEKYLLKQAEIMKPFTAKVFYGERAFEEGGELFPYVDARSFALPQFTEFRKELYPEGIKIISTQWLQKLTPSGFAFWFLDDGSTTGYGFDICTFDPFFKTKEAINVLADVLNLKVSITWNSEGEGNIHVLKESHNIAWEYIQSEITEDLYHKIPKRFCKDNQQPSFARNSIEGSTTGENLNSIYIEHDDNSHFEKVISQDMPGFLF